MIFNFLLLVLYPLEGEMTLSLLNDDLVLYTCLILSLKY